jgi:hypothetical protein
MAAEGAFFLSNKQHTSAHMKNLLFSLFAFFACLSAANAQFFALGIKGGISSQVNKPGGIQIAGDHPIALSVKDFKYGTQIGGFMRIGNKFFFEPEVLVNSNKTDYTVKTSLGEVIKNERYNYLDMPLLLGFSFGPFRLSGGPVGHYFISSTSELTDVQGYSAKFKQMEWGWLTGLTIGRGRISADIRYESNFSKFGDHMNFFGQPYHFSSNPARFIVALNIALIK